MRPSAAIGYWTGALFGLMLIVFLLMPQQEKFHASGPANIGHESLKCTDCHRRAPGDTRQQIQAKVKYWLGLRKAPVNFQFSEVTNNECKDCHDRPEDNHPTHRFFEPRFAKARASIHPEKCISCHREHEGIRITIESTFCSNCHEKLKLKQDPLETTHKQLIRQKQWSSCLVCHDFHGNHIMEIATTPKQGIEQKQIIDYFNGSPSPYSKQKHFTAKETLDD